MTNDKLYTVAEALSQPQYATRVVARSPKDMSLVSRFPSLEELHCHLSDEALDWNHAKSELIKLQTLKTLHLIYPYPDSQMLEVVAVLPRLKELHLVIAKGIKKKIPVDWLAQLGKLSQLTHLSIIRHKLTEVPESMGQLTHLQELSLAYNRFTHLSFREGDFPNLYTLRLYGNKLTQLPAGLIHLKSLQQLELSENTLGPNVAYKIQLLKKIRLLAEPLRSRAWAVFVDDEPETEPMDGWELSALLSIELKVFQQKVHQMLHQRIKNSFQPEPVINEVRICLLGNEFFGVRKKELTERLQMQQITVHSKWQADTTHVVAGDNLKANSIAEIDKTSVSLATADHLRQWLEHLEQPYLKQSDEAMAENLLRLVQSAEEENVVLAAQMITTGGIPEAVLYHVFCLCFPKINLMYNLAPTLRKAFVRTGPFEMVHLVKKYWQKENEGLASALLQDETLDKKRLLDAAFDLFLPEADNPPRYMLRLPNSKEQLQQWCYRFFQSLIVQITYKDDNLAEYALAMLKKENIFQRIASQDVTLLYPWLKTKGKIHAYVADIAIGNRELDLRGTWTNLMTLPHYLPIETLIVYEHNMSGMNDYVIRHLAQIKQLKTIVIHKDENNWNIDEALKLWQQIAPRIQLIRVEKEV